MIEIKNNLSPSQKYIFMLIFFKRFPGLADLESVLIESFLWVHSLLASVCNFLCQKFRQCEQIIQIPGTSQNVLTFSFSHCVETYWIRTEKRPLFVRMKTCIASVSFNLVLTLFLPYSLLPSKRQEALGTSLIIWSDTQMSVSTSQYITSYNKFV